MENLKDDEIFLGLDVGDGSVGWALTDEEYNLVKIKGQHAWGARLFDAAEDCKQRRTFRSNRRRLQRRKYRIKLLQELFNDSIVKKDESFFMRMKESGLTIEDKKFSPWTLFNTQEEEIKYNQKYPTIWHLRQDLVKNSNSDAYNDIRLVYLAIHHIIKYRGNFLKEGQTFNFKSIDDNTLIEINEIINQNLNLFGLEQEIKVFDLNEKNQLVSLLVNTSLSMKEKEVELKKMIHTDNKEMLECISKLILGKKYDFSKILNSEEKLAVEFKNIKDEDLEILLTSLGDIAPLVVKCKTIYDFVVLYELLAGEEYLCDSMVKIYEKHKRNLKLLKTKIRKADQILDNNFNNYNAIFGEASEKPFNYAKYIQSSGSQSAYFSFEDTLIKLFAEYKKAGIDLFDELIEQSGKQIKIKKEYSLETINLNSTSVIPHQLHLNELIAILKNLEEKYPEFDNEKINRILQIFKFKIPYYVGPFTDDSKMSQYQTLVKKEGKKCEKILPWNFDDVVDIEKTREKFMGVRLNKCMFLYGEDVLPKSSLLYEEYSFLDKINALKINGENINKVTRDKILKSALNKQYLTKKDIVDIVTNKENIEVSITGVDFVSNKLTFGLISHNYFLKKNFDLEKDREMIEEIIKILTFYKEDTKPAYEILRCKYPKLDSHKLASVMSFKTTGFGAFSKKFLNGAIVGENADGCVIEPMSTPIKLMYDNVETFEQVRYKYFLDNAVAGFNSKINYDKKFVEEEMEYIPPIIRRSVNQAISIVDELNDLLKKKNKKVNKIFIEVTREANATKERTKSRYESLKIYLNDLKKQKDLVRYGIDNLLGELETYKDNLNGQALYLYFTQLGYDLYSGDKITSIEDVIEGKYDIDHIIPQSIMKDDSIDNKVLVNRNANQKVKGDKYPLPIELQNEKTIRIWNILHTKKVGKNETLMSDKKYSALIRKTPLTNEELNTFVNRQISTLNYANREIVKILELKYPYLKGNIIFSKAGFVSDFRHINKIYKFRDINDTHHAVDAYLNVVVGNVIYNTFTKKAAKNAIINKILENQEGNNKEKVTLNFMRIFTNPWNSYWNESLQETVIDTCYRHDMLMTKKSFVDYGPLYKQTIFKKGSKSNLVPIHTSNELVDTNKYGGYSSLNTSQFALVSYTNKNKVLKGIIGVPLIDLVSSNTKETLNSKLSERYELKDLEVLRLIKNNSLMQINGTRFLLTGASVGDPRIGLNIFEPLFIDKQFLDYYHLLLRFDEKLSNDQNLLEQKFIVNKNGDFEKISKELNLKLYTNLLAIFREHRFNFLYNIGAIQNLLSTKDIFANLSLHDQSYIIQNVIKLFNSNYRDADFKLLNNKDANIEFKTIQYRVSPRNIEDLELVLISNSITGLRCKKVKL